MKPEVGGSAETGGPQVGQGPRSKPGAPNLGKVRRLVRELMAVLVEELGPDGAVQVLEQAQAQIRGAGCRPMRATTHEERRLLDGRKRA